LKRGGAGAIVDRARVHALGAGLVSVNTRARLLAAGRAGALIEEMAASLVDALEFISYVRLAHQARQFAAGTRPDSRLSPRELTAFEQRALREAFHVIRSASQALPQRHPGQFYSWFSAGGARGGDAGRRRCPPPRRGPCGTTWRPPSPVRRRPWR